MTITDVCKQSGGSMLVVFCLACEAGGGRTATLETWSPPTKATLLHPVVVSRPSSADGLDTQDTEVSGAPAAIACATCHSEGSSPAFALREGVGKGFHRKVTLAHGDLQCGSCHSEKNPGQLHRASGDLVPLADSMALCSQCHGQQRLNFDHGAHGGMRGYWDRQRGPQLRNDCVACHTAHAPEYPLVTPMPAPRDRFAVAHDHPGSLVERRYGRSRNSESNNHE